MPQNGYIALTCEYYQEGRKWVARCPELGTATFGRSLPDAQRKLEEAIELHLDTLEKVGERERFFRENNIVLHHTPPRILNVPARKDVFFHSCVRKIAELTPA